MSAFLQSCGEIPKPTRWPLQPMLCYGTIPGRPEEPLYRIVFAPTVQYLVGGNYTNPETGTVEFTGYMPRPRYDYIGDKWIMEKWVSAKDFTGETEAQYRARWEDPETHLCLTGPYPRDGEWQWVWTFNKPEFISANGIVAALVNKAKYNSKAAVKAHLEEEQKALRRGRFEQSFTKMKDAQRVSGIRAANIGGRVKAQKSYRELQPAPFGSRGVRTIKPSVQELTVAGY